MKRILLVEDEPFDQILFTRQLQRLRPDWEVHCVATVRDAIAAIADDGFDMVVTDLTLPDAHGPEAIEAMLTAVDDIPVVVVSGMDPEALDGVVDGHAVAAVQHKGRFDMAALAALID